MAESGFDELSNRHRGTTFSTKTNTLLWFTCIYKVVVNQTSDSAALIRLDKGFKGTQSAMGPRWSTWRREMRRCRAGEIAFVYQSNKRNESITLASK